MPNRRLLLRSFAAFAALTLNLPAAAQADEPVSVVATFSILGDMVKRVGGDKVAVTTLVGPNGDTHVYRPTPADARAVSQAKVLVVNGLAFEGWLDRLVEASEFRGHRVVATEGIKAIAYEDDHDEEEHGAEEHHASEAGHDHDDHDHAGHDDHAEHAGHHDHAGHDHHGEHAGHHDHNEHADHDDHREHEEAGGHHHHHHGAFDPHAWQSLANAAIYVDNIAAALAKADPANAETYQRNRTAYLAEIKALDAEIRGIVGAIRQDRPTVVTSHDAFQYFGRDYGLTFVAPQGLSTESEASAGDVARLIEHMREESVWAVFIENISDPRLLERIAEETGATIGGTLYPGALSGPEGPAPSYLEMMHHNAMTLAQALSS